MLFGRLDRVVRERRWANAQDASMQYEGAAYTKRFSTLQKLALGSEILLAYGRVRLSLVRKDFPEILSSLRTAGDDPLSQPALVRQNVGWRLGKVVATVLGALPSDSRCLTRSLVLIYLLNRRAISSTLVIGVAPGPEFGAHAWVEIEGVPLLPPLEGQFSRLVEL